MTDELLDKKVSRRTLLRVGGCAGISVAACGATGVIVGTQTDLLDRIQGISDTPLLENKAAWTYTEPTLTLELDQIPELAQPGHGIRLEDDSLPDRLLIVYGEDSSYYVYLNKCTHGERRIDPVGGKLECTSFSKATYDYNGEKLSGPAKGPLTTYEASVVGNQLVITLT